MYTYTILAFEIIVYKINLNVVVYRQFYIFYTMPNGLKIFDRKTMYVMFER